MKTMYDNNKKEIDGILQQCYNPGIMRNVIQKSVNTMYEIFYQYQKQSFFIQDQRSNYKIDINEQLNDDNLIQHTGINQNTLKTATQDQPQGDDIFDDIQPDTTHTIIEDIDINQLNDVPVI